MRKIMSAGEEAKRKKRNQIIIGVLLALIMVLSTLGFALQGSLGGGQAQGQDSGLGNEVEYNGFRFVNYNGLWVLGSFVFRYLPQQVPDVKPEAGFEIKPASKYQGMPAYVYSEDSEAESEIIVNLGQVAQRVQRACPEDIVCEGEENLPVKTCNDNFVIIKESNSSNSIRQEGNCVFIDGEKEQLAALADQFLFKTLGVR